MTESSETFDGSANWETHAFQVCWTNDYDVRALLLNAAQEALTEDYDLSDFDLGQAVIRRAQAITSEHNSLRLMATADIVGHWERIDSAEVGEETRDLLSTEGML